MVPLRPLALFALALLCPLAAPARAAEPVERWALWIDLPGAVEVGGIGRIENLARTAFLLTGPLAQAHATRCSLEVDSPMATASPRDPLPPAGAVAFSFAGSEVALADGTALTLRGPVTMVLRTAGLAVAELIVEVTGPLRLEGRRLPGGAASGAVVVSNPTETLRGPSFLDIRVPPRAEARGTFTLARTRAGTCAELLDAR